LIRWGESLGPATGRVVTEILARFPHPEQGYRACLGLLSLERKYNRLRVEAACTRALATGAVSYRSVKSMLATGVDQLSLLDSDADTGGTATLRLPLTHAHIRGADYYRRALTPSPTSDPTEDLPHAD
jgi:hypothetical protein